MSMLKVAIIGLGYWGPNLLRNFYKHPLCEVVAICDSDPSRLKQQSGFYKTIPVKTTDYRDLLLMDIDLVAIATPPETHYKLAKEALLAGKHILVEKPFTKASVEAEKLIDIAERRGLKIFVDHTFVFHPVVRKIKELLDKKELGEIYYFDSERVNLGLLQVGVNVIWDLAVHDLSIISYLFPDLKFVKVQAFGSKHIHPYYEDMAHIVLEAENGFIAHIHVSWLSPVKIRKTIIGGSKKMLWWDDIHPFEKLKLYDSRVEFKAGEETPFSPVYVKGDIKIIRVENKEPLAIEVDSVVRTILGGRRPEVGGIEGLEVVKLLEKCSLGNRVSFS